MSNDIGTLNELFRNSPLTVRYGVAETCTDMSRSAHSARLARRSGLHRTLHNTVITTYGRDFAIASTEFRLEAGSRTGRQMQSWVRFPEGWRIVAAHVSLIDPPS